LTREESRARTRARLISFGRAHFLRHGLGGAVAEKIAEDAGYSRGALYSNFDGKEELFLAVIHEQKSHHFEIFESILGDSASSVKERLRRFRNAFVEVITDRDWVVLYSEFEAAALRNRRIRANFLKLHRRTILDGTRLLNELLKSSGVTLKMKPHEFVMTMLSFSLGMAVNQKILGDEFSSQCARGLVESLFDELISAP
jgi:AcrR family transcriptional regulator